MIITKHESRCVQRVVRLAPKFPNYAMHDLDNNIIHISDGFEGDIPEYQPRGDTKALARYVTRCRRQRVT